MTYDELVSAVYTITGRPDRVGETSLAIYDATLKAHQSDFYYKDLFETGIIFDTIDYFQQIDYRSLFPTYRAIKYIRIYDNVNLAPGNFLTLVPTEKVVDGYLIQRQDIYYVAGAEINIYFCQPQQTIIAGVWLNPVAVQQNYSSWVALDHPFAIIYSAAATVFKAIGKDEEAAAYKTLVAEQYALLATSNILPNGY
jgi:hypothetical protein